MAKFELNDFDRNDTRLPELSIDITRQPLWNGLFYQGNSSVGVLEEHLGGSDEANKQFLIDQGEEYLKSGGLTDLLPAVGLPPCARSGARDAACWA